MKSYLFFSLAFLVLIHIPKEGICQNKSESNLCRSEYRFDGRKLLLSREEWKARLSPEQFAILREGKTEPPFKNAYFDNEKEGIYQCAGCHLPLYSSEAKFDSGTGWPSFWAPLCSENITVKKSLNPFASGKEVTCSRCEGHLGDVFNDGPPPTGRRYCMDSAALEFLPK